MQRTRQILVAVNPPLTCTFESGCRDLNPGPLDPQSLKGGSFEIIADLRFSVDLLVGPYFLVAVGIPRHPLFFGAAWG